MPLVGPSKVRLPTGISDFKKLRRSGYSYVDKTQYIAHVIDSVGEALLFPRPRRFGKTLGMSTLRYFFESGGEDYTDLFEDTWIWQADGGRYRDEHFGKHPVIYLTFKDAKGRSWEETWDEMRSLLVQEIHRLVATYALGPVITRDIDDKTWLERIERNEAPALPFRTALRRLERWLLDATGQEPVILIDEYDAPLHAAYEYGYWDEAVSFFRAFLSAGFKDATGVYRAILTGILKVAKENIFSGLNNVRTYSILSQPFAADFGFTEQEVEELLPAAGVEGQVSEVQRWYNGYRFGSARPVTIFNPWSLTNYLETPEEGPRSFWNATSDNALVRKAMLLHAAAESRNIEALLHGEAIEVDIEESVVLRELPMSASSMWNLLLFAGYLTPTEVHYEDTGPWARVRVPNVEVSGVFRSIFKSIVQSTRSGGLAGRLTEAMLAGEVDAMEALLRDVLENVMSYFDFGGKKPIEAVYQAFVMGLLVHLSETHHVRSNRESGYGRADVLITPKTGEGPGAVMELKVIDTNKGETPEQAANSALEQVLKLDYASEVRAAGAEPVWVYGVVFDGKRCWVKMPQA